MTKAILLTSIKSGHYDQAALTIGGKIFSSTELEFSAGRPGVDDYSKSVATAYWQLIELK
ncbi:MAG: hypothetical protein JEZ12_22910 [Desulfobacterium sp.]|nr:hypothetical protein [Desulfobacterium sp.]